MPVRVVRRNSLVFLATNNKIFSCLVMEGSMKKWVSIFVIVAFGIIALTEAVFLFLSFGKETQSRVLLDSVNNKLSEATTKNTELEGVKSDLQYSNGQCSQEIDSLTSEKAQLITTSDELTVKFDSLEKENKTNLDSIVSLKKENKALTDRFMCKDQIKGVTFIDNKMVNTLLVKYVEDTSNLKLPVTSHSWNIVWSDSKYSIHTIGILSTKDNINYIWKFTVYFKGEAYGEHANGIFYNDQQCWLYLEY
jgi:hypothetical protein